MSKPTRDEVFASLKRHVPHLNNDIHRAVVTCLESDGIVSDGGEIRASALAAADTRHKEATLRLAAGELRRLGIDFAPKVNVHQVNAALTDRKVPVDQRMRIKAVLAAAGLID